MRRLSWRANRGEARSRPRVRLLMTRPNERHDLSDVPPGMVLIPAGPFAMGSGDGNQNEQPVHQVQVDAFWIDRFPVTVAAYAEYVEATGRPAPPSWRGATPRNGHEKYPVVDVTWEEARDFAAWSGKRLPTEAEWEKAAAWDDAAQHSRRWPWGDEWESGRANAGSGILAIFRNRGPNEAGRFSPSGDSAYGVSCMAGNVWEWTSSLFLPYPYDPRDGRESRRRQAAESFAVVPGATRPTRLVVPHDWRCLHGAFLTEFVDSGAP